MNNVIRGGLLVTLALGVFWPVLNAEFLSYDDSLYVTESNFVRQGLSWSNFCWAWTSFEAANWHPLTWLSLMLDWELYGLNPTGFHATNLVLHIVNTLLLFRLLLRIAPEFPWRGFVVALLFAIHPLHVESVAWVAERKDLLFTAFGLLALHAYVSYARGSRQGYWWCVGWLLLSLMSKSMLLTFPFLLLLLDYWPLCRTTQRTWRQLVLEKWPMFVIVVGVGFAALQAQVQGGAASSLQRIPLSIRSANAVLAYGLYLWDTVWPTGLSAIYLHPFQQLSFAEVGLALVVMLAISSWLFWFRQRLPAAWVGWCWFVGTLVPVIGIVQVGAQQRADRYTYFPLIGLFLGIVWSVSNWMARSERWRSVVASATSIVIVGLCVASHAQVQYWKTSQTLFEHALKIEPLNPVAHAHLGNVQTQKGDFEAAISHYRQAIKFYSTDLTVQFNLAYALMEAPNGPNKAEQRKEAIAITKQILTQDPNHALACNLKGNVLRESGRREEALKNLRIACAGLPNDVSIRSNLAVTLYELGQRDEAQREFALAKQQDPENPTLLLNLGVIEFQEGRVAQAIELFEHAERVAPGLSRAKRFHASARLTLGALALQQGKASEALREFARSEDLEPRVWQLQVNFGEAFLLLKRAKPAETRFLKALEINPQCAEAHFGLGRVYVATQQLGLATEHLTAALKLRPDFPPAQELLKSLQRADE